MKKSSNLKLFFGLVCAVLTLSSGAAYSEDELSGDIDMPPLPGDLNAGSGAPATPNVPSVAPEKAAACGAILSKLKGQDNKSAQAQSEKSDVPGNWALACQNSKLDYNNCTLTAECNDSVGQKMPATSINLSGCIDKEVKNSKGNLICN